MSDLNREGLALYDELQRRLTAAHGKVTRGVEKRETLQGELHDAKLNLESMENWKKWVLDADTKAAAALSQVSEVKGKLDKAS